MNTERFNRAITKLVKAFFENDLAAADCRKCAVGNMCDGEGVWSNVFVTGIEGQVINEDQYIGLAKEIIDKTGYSWQELARIEKTFEENTALSWSDYFWCNKSEIMEDQYNGLMAVVDVLCEIEGFDEEVTNETKKLFVAT